MAAATGLCSVERRRSAGRSKNVRREPRGVRVVRKWRCVVGGVGGPPHSWRPQRFFPRFPRRRSPTTQADGTILLSSRHNYCTPAAAVK